MANIGYDFEATSPIRKEVGNDEPNKSNVINSRFCFLVIWGVVPYIAIIILFILYGVEIRSQKSSLQVRKAQQNKLFS